MSDWNSAKNIPEPSPDIKTPLKETKAKSPPKKVKDKTNYEKKQAKKKEEPISTGPAQVVAASSCSMEPCVRWVKL